MLSSVPRIVIYAAVAAVSFYAGGRIEPLLFERGGAQAAQAGTLGGPAALRLGGQAPINSGALHNDAIQAGAAAQSIEAEAPEPVPVAVKAEAAPEADDKPSTVNGRDPETDAEFVEMKNMPEIQGQGADPNPGRDVDMIGEVGLPVPDSKTDSSGASGTN